MQKKNQMLIDTKHLTNLKSFQSAVIFQLCSIFTKHLNNHINNKNGYKEISQKRKDNTKAYQKYDSDLDSDPKTCMEFSEVVMGWSDLSDHRRKVIKKLIKIALLI